MARENTLNMEELANATIAVSELLSDLPDIPEDKLSALLGTGLSVSNDSGKEVAAAIKDIVASLNAMDSLRDPIDLLSELADTYNSLPDGSEKKVELLSNGTISTALSGILEAKGLGLTIYVTMP